MARPESGNGDRRRATVIATITRAARRSWSRRRAPIVLAAIPFAGLGVYLVHAVVVGFDDQGLIFRSIVAGFGICLIAVAVGFVRCSLAARKAGIALATIGASSCAGLLLLLLVASGQSRDVGYLPLGPLILGLVAQVVIIELLVAAWPNPGTDGESTASRT